MGGKSDGGKGALIAESRQMADRARAEMEKVQLPDIEKMKLALEEDRLVGLLNAEELADTQFKDIRIDPRYEQAQRDALFEYDRMSKEGMSLADKIGLEEISQSVSAQDKARRDSILSSMQERGALDSGESLAAQLQGAQASTQSAQQRGNEMNKAMIQARRDALSNKANLGGKLAEQDYGRQSNVAQSMDAINKFRTQNRQNVNQQNLAAKQGISSGNVELRNTQQQYNKQLIQQDFNNQMARQGAIAGAYGAQAANALSSSDRMTPKKGMGAMIGTGVGAAAGAYFSAGNPQATAAGANVGGAVGSQFADGGLKGQSFFGGGLKNTPSIADIRQMDESQAPEVFDPYKKYTPGQQLAMNGMNNFGTFNPNAPIDREPKFTNLLKNVFSGKPKDPLAVEPAVTPAVPAMPEADSLKKKEDDAFMQSQLSGIASNLRGYNDGGIGEQPKVYKTYSDKYVSSGNMNPKIIADLHEKMLPKEYVKNERFNIHKDYDNQMPFASLNNDEYIQSLLGGNKNKFLEKRYPDGYESLDPDLVDQYLKRRGFSGFNDGGVRVDEAVDMGMMKPNVNAQKELLAVARGDIMPEDSSGGRIIGGNSYSGDKLPDRINSGEMVFNLHQQDNMKSELDNKTAEVEGFRKLLRMIGKK